MKRLLIVLAVLALVAGAASARREAYVPRHVRDAGRVDWFWFDDLEPDDPGWTHGDYTATYVPWFHVDTYMAYSGTYSWWCGTFDHDADGGYGNNWDDRLDCEPTPWTGYAYPVVTFAYRNDTEDGYDFTYVDAESLGEWVHLNRGYSGIHPWSTTGYYLGDKDDPAVTRFRFVSDSAFSDEDMLYLSNGGAFMCDEISIWDYYSGTVLLYCDAEAGTYGCCTKKERFDSPFPAFECSGGNCNLYVNAQSFSPTESYELCAVSVPLNTAWMGTSQSATLHIQDGPGAGAAVYASASRSDISTSVECGHWYKFNTEPDINVTANETYYIRVTGEVLWYEYYADDFDAYPRGKAYLDGMVHEEMTPDTLDRYDFYFTTYTYGNDCTSDVCVPGGPPTAGDYWHIIENNCKAYSDPHVWVNTATDTNVAFVPPNVQNWLRTPDVDISRALTCTTYFVIQFFTPTVDSDHWTEEVTTDGGASWTQLHSWWGDQCDAGYTPCDHFLGGDDITALLPGTVGAHRWTYYTSDNGAGPDICGCAGITLDDIGFYGEEAPTAIEGRVEEMSWGRVKALYR